MTYRHAKIFVFLVLSLYLTVGIAARALSAATEDVYPFFSWFLFAQVPPRTQTDFAIRVGNAFLEDTSLYDRRIPWREYYATIQRLGNAAGSGRAAEEATLRTWIESKLPAPPPTYELVRVTFDPIARWKNEEILGVEHVGLYHTKP